jgi:hypothetical protein
MVTKNKTQFFSIHFIKGMASCIDLFGSLNNYSNIYASDKEAIQNDWSIIGNDMKSIIDLEKQSSCNGKK